MGTLQRFGSWLVVLLLAGAMVSAGEPKKAPPELTPEQRQELEKQIAAKEKEAAKAEEAEDFAKARTLRQEVLELTTKRYGASDWHSTDARLVLAQADVLVKLDAAQREQLREATKLNNQGLRLVKEKGQHAAAEPLLRKALAIRQKVLGEEHPDTAISYGTVAANLSAQGKYADAERLLRKALTFWQKALGEQHPNTANSYSKLALNLNAQGKYTDAELLLRKALVIHQKALGEEHPDTAASYDNLAENLNAQGKYADAEPLYRKALTIRQKVLGEEHLSTAASYNNVAANLDAQGKYADAEPLHRKAHAICRKALGEQHPTTATSYNNVGFNLNAQGKYADAEPFYRSALTIFQKALGEQHPSTATSYNNVAFNLNAQSKYADAEPLYRKALAIWQEMLGEQHPRTAVGYNNLACNLDAQGRYADAEPLYRKALAIRQQALGEEHPDTANSYNNLAFNLDAQGKYADAEPHCRKALAINQNTVGEQHPKTAASFSNLAFNLNAQGRYADAESFGRKALAIRQGVLGEEHPDTAASYNSLARNLDAQGKYADAEPLYRKALAIDRKTLEEQHRNTATGYNNLAFNLDAQGKYAQAESFARRAAASFQKVRSRVAFSGLDRATFTTERSPLPMLTVLLARNAQPADAWHWCEENLAHGLLDDLSVRDNRRLTDAERRSQDELRRRLDQIDKQLLALAAVKELTTEQQERRAGLFREASRVQGEWAQFQSDLEKKYGPAAGQVYDLARIQKQLPAHAALVVWLDRKAPADPRGDHWACLLRTAGPPQWVRLSGSGPQGAWTAEDDALPGRLRELLQKHPADRTAWQDLAQQLAAQRLTPLEEHLRGEDNSPITHLVILPSEVLAGIPVEVLTERYSISYAPSATLFAYAQEQQQIIKESGRLGHPARLLALGDPTFLPPPPPAPRPTPPEQGVLIAGVQPASNASRAGITAGDVLLRYAGVVLASNDDLKAAIARNTEPTERAVDLWRNGKTLTVQVKPGPLGVSLSSQPLAEALRSLWEGRDAVARSVRGTAFAPLPGTRREVEALARLIPDTKRLLGSEASEQQLDALARAGTLRDYRYLHLATHGQANAERGLWSFLALANDDLPDPLTIPAPGQKLYRGQLSAADMLAWNLDADLVTLSACETGLGRKEGGEGYVGFAQALFLAGARSIALSQWKVDDTATALLMQRFYQNLLGKRPGLDAPLDKAAALAEAKRWLRQLNVEEVQQLSKELPAARGLEVVRPITVTTAQPFAHPYCWASFILIGDPGDVSQAVPVLAPAPVAALPANMSGGPHWSWFVVSGVVVLVGSGWLWRRSRRAPGRPA